MGADLLLVAVPLPTFRGVLSDDELVEKVAARLLSRWEASPYKRDIADSYCGLFGDWYWSDGDEEPFLDLEMAKVIAHSVFIECRRSREACLMDFGDRVYLVTGGTSFGDEPCQYWDEANFIKELMLTADDYDF